MKVITNENVSESAHSGFAMGNYIIDSPNTT